MEINLLPRKSFVEKRFFMLSFTVFLILLALTYTLWSKYLYNSNERLALLEESQAKQLEKATLLDNLGWNEEVKKYDEQVQDIKRYELLIDGLHHVEVDWSRILSHVESLLPSPNTITFSTKGNYLSGTVLLGDLQTAAAFIEQLKTYEEFHDVYIDVIQSGTITTGYQVQFSAYLKLLSF